MAATTALAVAVLVGCGAVVLVKVVTGVFVIVGSGWVGVLVTVGVVELVEVSVIVDTTARTVVAPGVAVDGKAITAVAVGARGGVESCIAA